MSREKILIRVAVKSPTLFYVYMNELHQYAIYSFPPPPWKRCEVSVSCWWLCSTVSSWAKITATSEHTRGVISDHGISYTFICITIKASESVSMVVNALIEKDYRTCNATKKTFLISYLICLKYLIVSFSLLRYMVVKHWVKSYSYLLPLGQKSNKNFDAGFCRCISHLHRKTPKYVCKQN